MSIFTFAHQESLTEQNLCNFRKSSKQPEKFVILAKSTFQIQEPWKNVTGVWLRPFLPKYENLCYFFRQSWCILFTVSSLLLKNIFLFFPEKFRIVEPKKRRCILDSSWMLSLSLERETETVKKAYVLFYAFLCNYTSLTVIIEWMKS